MLPLGDLLGVRRLPVVTLGIALANLLAWILYEQRRGLDEALREVGFRACGIDGSCPDTGLPWPVEALTSMFAHGSWSHIAGNLAFLLAFGIAVEDVLGRARMLVLYLVAGLAGDALDAAGSLLLFPDAALLPSVGASGAISGLLGAYLVIRPFQRILVWVVPVLFLRIPALALLGVFFVTQALQGSYVLAYPEAQVGIGFLAHVGGFLAGVVVAGALLPGTWPRALIGRRATAG